MGNEEFVCLVVSTNPSEKWTESQWEGWHPTYNPHMKWKIKNVPNHQPVVYWQKWILFSVSFSNFPGLESWKSLVSVSDVDQLLFCLRVKSCHDHRWMVRYLPSSSDGFLSPEFYTAIHELHENVQLQTFNESWPIMAVHNSRLGLPNYSTIVLAGIVTTHHHVLKPAPAMDWVPSHVGWNSVVVVELPELGDLGRRSADLLAIGVWTIKCRQYVMLSLAFNHYPQTYNKTMENHHFSWVNQLFQWPCLIANS